MPSVFSPYRFTSTLQEDSASWRSGNAAGPKLRKAQGKHTAPPYAKCELGCLSVKSQLLALSLQNSLGTAVMALISHQTLQNKANDSLVGLALLLVVL